MKVRRSARQLLSAVFAAGLLTVACGGSGDDDTSPTGPTGVNDPPRGCSVPPAPENLRATTNETRVTLTWNAVPNIIDYHVMIGSAPSSSNLFTTNTGSTTYQWNGNGVGVRYARVAARNLCGTGPSSNEAVINVTSPN